MKMRIGAPVLVAALFVAVLVAVIREPPQAPLGATTSEAVQAEVLDAPPGVRSSGPAREQHAVPVASLAKPDFAWPIPVSVPVVERVTKADADAALAYRLEVCPRPDGHAGRSRSCLANAATEDRTPTKDYHPDASRRT